MRRRINRRKRRKTTEVLIRSLHYDDTKKSSRYEQAWFGAEAGIVNGGIAKRFDSSGDSSAHRSRTLDALLFLFVSLCCLPPASVAESNTLITPGPSDS